MTGKRGRAAEIKTVLSDQIVIHDKFQKAPYSTCVGFWVAPRIDTRVQNRNVGWFRISSGVDHRYGAPVSYRYRYNSTASVQYTLSSVLENTQVACHDCVLEDGPARDVDASTVARDDDDCPP